MGKDYQICKKVYKKYPAGTIFIDLVNLVEFESTLESASGVQMYGDGNTYYIPVKQPNSQNNKTARVYEVNHEIWADIVETNDEIDELKSLAMSRYKIGVEYIIDQKTAYNLSYSTSHLANPKTDDDYEVTLATDCDGSTYYNVAICGVGVYNSAHGKWAEYEGDDIGDCPFEVGDEIVIIKEPKSWTDLAGGKCPIGKNISYPLTTIVQNIEKDEYPDGSNIKGFYYGIKAGGYGWSYSKKNLECFEKPKLSDVKYEEEKITISTKLKKGDRIRILEKPTYWCGELGGDMGLEKVTYPYELTIKGVKKMDLSTGDEFFCVFDGKYGWCIDKDSAHKFKLLVDKTPKIDPYSFKPIVRPDVDLELILSDFGPRGEGLNYNETNVIKFNLPKNRVENTQPKSVKLEIKSIVKHIKIK